MGKNNINFSLSLWWTDDVDGEKRAIVDDVKYVYIGRINYSRPVRNLA